MFQFYFRIILRDIREQELFHDNLTLPKYPEGASSNPTGVNIYQLASAVLDYNEKISVHVYL